MMLCPSCMVEMLPSKALRPHECDCGMARCMPGYYNLQKSEELYLIDCFKCPKCGYSDSTKEQLENGKKVIS